MPLYDGARCDLCSQDKKETVSGWFLCRTEGDVHTVRPLDVPTARDWERNQIKFAIACGPNCSVQWLQKQLMLPEAIMMEEGGKA